MRKAALPGTDSAKKVARRGEYVYYLEENEVVFRGKLASEWRLQSGPYGAMRGAFETFRYLCRNIYEEMPGFPDWGAVPPA